MRYFLNIKIPEKFENILRKNDVYYSEIVRLNNDFTKWTKDNKLEFFPEYTDHGSEHIQSVLDTAENIINEQSFSILTPEDIYVLISSILLHDSAMHIDKFGLWSLLTHDIFNGAVIGNNNQQQWIDKWNIFVKSVNKFEEKDWNNFFGKYESIKLPEINESNLNDKQKIIIGDFIRQHHADIAQIIASFGIPTKDISYKIFNENFTRLNQLAGFIAKSHNYNLREMVDLLGGEQKSRQFQNTHPAFLMGVLRISDYLQFTKERTPKILFEIKGKGMCSPISIKEWTKHLSILNYHQENSDTELIFVEANPENALILESIKKLFKGFQNELDSFWAVNGEIYSRYNNLSKLGLTIRRIKSNIDNANSYVEQNYKNFYPEILNIKSDNQKILPLLVSPLYGDFPQIGIRELLQNSIDACNERYSLNINREVNKEDIPYEINITIDLDENTFTIEDNGMGMDIDIIKNYFLKVGSSYRYSEVWKANYSDEKNIFVPRTGKFGIGMLAGFLIGKKIFVDSKKEEVSNDKALKFNYSLNTQNIEINYTHKEEVGTKITIESDKKTLTRIINSFENTDHSRNHELSSFWYFLDTPKINISKIDNKEYQIINNNFIKNKSYIFSTMKSIEDSELEGFFWDFRNNYYTYNKFEESLFCNGIIITNYKLPELKLDLLFTFIIVKLSDIYVFDNKGLFPLNLTRDNLVSKEFFEINKLRENVFYHFFNFIKKIIKDFLWNQQSILKIFNLYYERFWYNDALPFIFFQNSIISIENPKLKNEYILFDFILPSSKRGLIYNKTVFPLLNNIAYSINYDIPKNKDSLVQIILNFIFRKKTERSYNSYFFFQNIPHYKDKSIPINLKFQGWIFVKTYDYNKFDKNEKSKMNSLFQNNLYVKELNDEWTIICDILDKDSIPKIGLEIIKFKRINSFIFTICKFEEIEETEFSELWNKYIN